mmetsp:Transcript_19066/g.35772  ORF Transcript_19066/g.35772 Transcript_19066/m.35772 type:complete len:80 (+) Transcript_19066:429-668(+)
MRRSELQMDGKALCGFHAGTDACSTAKCVRRSALQKFPRQKHAVTTMNSKDISKRCMLLFSGGHQAPAGPQRGKWLPPV